MERESSRNKRPRQVVLIPFPVWLQHEYQPAREECVCGKHPRVLTLQQIMMAWADGHPEKKGLHS